MGKNRKNRCVRMTDDTWNTAEEMAKEKGMSNTADYIDRAIMYQAIRDDKKRIKKIKERLTGIEEIVNVQG